MSEKKLIECAECSNEFDPNDGGSWIEGVGDVCGDCRYEAGRECVVCEERYGKQGEYWSGLILANHEFAALGDLWVPGFYRYERGFYTPSMIGSGFVSDEYLLFAGTAEELPETSGYVCRDCGAEASAAAALYYGPKARKQYGRTGRQPDVREMERHWMRAALAAHPDCLRGHECEPEELADFWKELEIEPLKTWSDWLVVEHKGVRVYSVYPIRDHVSWLTMDATTKGRGNYASGRFDHGHLPGHLPDWWKCRGYHGGSCLEYVRRALCHAIDRGYLRDGVPMTSEGLRGLPLDWEFRGREARREWEEKRAVRLTWGHLRPAEREVWESEAGALRAVVPHWDNLEEGKYADFLRGWNGWREGEEGLP